MNGIVKIALATIVATFSFVSLSAQTKCCDKETNLRWGVTAGLTVTNQKWSQDQFRQEPFDSDKSLGYSPDDKFDIPEGFNPCSSEFDDYQPGGIEEVFE